MAIFETLAKNYPSIPRLFNSVLPRPRPYATQGVAGTAVYAGYVLSPERSPKLIGQEKYRTFADIMTNTAIIAAGVRYFLNIVARPSWSCEAADDSPEAEKAKEFVEDILLEDLHTPWSRVVRRMGTFRFHGFSIQEWQAIKRDDGLIGLKDIESRPQWTIWRWEVDERGIVTGMWQRDPLTGRELGLPRGKVIYLVDDTLTDSPEGLGLLRHCVDPAFRLEEYLKQEGYGFQRDLRGIPIGRAPMDELQKAVNLGLMKKADMDTALQELTNFVSLETKDKNTALILNSQPYLDQSSTGQSMAAQYKWSVELMSGEAPGLADMGKAIDRITYEIARILGVESLLLGSSGAGSLAMSQDKSIHLYLLANAVLRDIRLQTQHDLIWPLWELNGMDDKLMPNLKTEDVSPRDVAQVASVLRDMATAGTPMSPDDEAQNFVRDLLGAPHVDLDAIKQQMDSLGEIKDQQDREEELGATGTGTGQDAGDEAATAPAQPQPGGGGKSGGGGGAAKKRLRKSDPDTLTVELEELSRAA